MATKKFLKAIRESAESDLPTNASDASAELADSLSGKVGARAVKGAHDGVKAVDSTSAVAAGKKNTVATEETEESDANDSDKQSVAEAAISKSTSKNVLKSELLTLAKELNVGSNVVDLFAKAFGSSESISVKELGDKMRKLSNPETDKKVGTVFGILSMELTEGADLPTNASAAKSSIPDSLDEEEDEDEKKAVAESDDADEDDKAVTEEEDEDEKKAVAESDDADADDDVKLSEEEEEKLDEEEEEDVKEAADALTKDENLPESFKTKVAAIFEAAVKRAANKRTEAYKAKLSEAYKAKLAAKKKTISETLVNKVDGYLDYVVEEWMKENEVAIESSLRSNVTEKFITGLKTLFESHYIEVPAEKADVISEQEKKIATLEKELNDQLVKGVELRKENIQLKKANIIKKHTEGLTVSDASKFAELCEGVSFENAKTFSQKLQVIKETYFPKSPKKSGDLDASLLTEGGIEHVESAPTTEVDVYADAISRMLKR